MLPAPSVRLLSGRYRGSFPGGEVELRVDVDGPRPLGCVSGDFFRVGGGTVTHASSFIVDEVTRLEGISGPVIEGTARFSDSAPSRKVRVIIQQVPALPQPPVATLQVIRQNGALQQEILCSFESGFFRTVAIKEDVERGVRRFADYGTDSLPPTAAQARRLSVIGAFSEAGIEMQPIEPSSAVGAPPGQSWSNAELHDAMERSLGELPDGPQWKVWLFHARRYEKEGTLGMMFDEQGNQRQGCAVFYRLVGGENRRKRREQLHTCMHEIGHCFNLHHSFAKSPILPNLPVRRDALSWMNYPSEFPGGANSFWKTFLFQFDDAEISHLRHGFRDDVIMGGRPFGGDAALLLPEIFRAPVEDRSGLDLRLEASEALNLGEPVWVELRLSVRGDEPREVHTHLHPREGYVQVALRKPGGDAVLFEPLFRRCMEEEITVLDEDNPAIYESAYLGYGKSGLHFRQPGSYQIRAVYLGLDGSRVLSNLLTLRIRSPFDPADDEVAGLYLGDEQGKLIAFRGSDSERLSNGNRALERVIKEFGGHPLASYARMVKGHNFAREFKTVWRDGSLSIRPVDLERAFNYLEPVEETFVESRSRISNITFGKTFRHLARAQLKVGDRRGAESTLDNLKANLLLRRTREVEEDKRSFKPHVLRAIDRQAEEVLEQA